METEWELKGFQSNELREVSVIGYECNRDVLDLRMLKAGVKQFSFTK